MAVTWKSAHEGAVEPEPPSIEPVPQADGDSRPIDHQLADDMDTYAQFDLSLDVNNPQEAC